MYIFGSFCCLFIVGGTGLTPKNWRRRWFVMKNGKIYYYKTPYVIKSNTLYLLWCSILTAGYSSFRNNRYSWIQSWNYKWDKEEKVCCFCWASPVHFSTNSAFKAAKPGARSYFFFTETVDQMTRFVCKCKWSFLVKH